MKIVDIDWFYEKYYSNNPELKRIVYRHSQLVAKKALEICKIKMLPLDENEVFSAAMLHDIGVVNCKAPSIHAHGQLPYLCHGLEGKKMLESQELFVLANVCLTHTGAGLISQDIIKNNLPLPPIDMIPKTLLEKLICYSDKFYSKSHDLEKEKYLNDIIIQMNKFGSGSLERFLEMHSLFG